MKPERLREELRGAAISFAHKKGLTVDTSHPTAVIFGRLSDAFHPESFKSVTGDPEWMERTTKPHQNVSSVLEMQSSNSSDALLMNVFCYPKLSSWKGIAQLLGFEPGNPVFGYKAKVQKQGTEGDTTEIDMVVDGCFVEAKLTETDFTEKATEEVHKYTNFMECFHADCLPITGDRYANYQVIRNILAAIQHGKQHMLICDERRPDLVRRYYETVSCLKKVGDRRSCRVVFWQEIAEACGKDLREFLVDKYALS